jgi:hypothetical protein
MFRHALSLNMLLVLKFALRCGMGFLVVVLPSTARVTSALALAEAVAADFLGSV